MAGRQRRHQRQYPDLYEDLFPQRSSTALVPFHDTTMAAATTLFPHSSSFDLLPDFHRRQERRLVPDFAGQIFDMIDRHRSLDSSMDRLMAAFGGGGGMENFEGGNGFGGGSFSSQGNNDD